MCFLLHFRDHGILTLLVEVLRNYPTLLRLFRHIWGLGSLHQAGAVYLCSHTVARTGMQGQLQFGTGEGCMGTALRQVLSRHVDCSRHSTYCTFLQHTAGDHGQKNAPCMKPSFHKGNSYPWAELCQTAVRPTSLPVSSDFLTARQPPWTAIIQAGRQPGLH